MIPSLINNLMIRIWVRLTILICISLRPLMYNIRLKLRYNNSHKLTFSKGKIIKRIINKRTNDNKLVILIVIIIELIEFHVFSTFYKNKIKIYFKSKIKLF